jgi:hypothetical protein
MRVPVDDLLGWVASLLTLITFAQTSMIPLRVTAILANVFFIAYGAMGDFLPVLTLHAVLLPLNSVRLVAHIGTSAARRAMVVSAPPHDIAPASAREDPFPPKLPARVRSMPDDRDRSAISVNSITPAGRGAGVRGSHIGLSSAGEDVEHATDAID